MKDLFLTASVIAALAVPTIASAQSAAEVEAAKKEIWELEQSIYAGRAKGDMTNYASNTATNYKAWPPMYDVPQDDSGMKAALQSPPPGPRQDKERLTMTFVDLVMSGPNTAVIYYKTHRTQLNDGSPADDRFETTHTWAKEDGKWRVLGGMARIAPKR